MLKGLIKKECGVCIKRVNKKADKCNKCGCKHINFIEKFGHFRNEDLDMNYHNFRIIVLNLDPKYVVNKYFKNINTQESHKILGYRKDKERDEMFFTFDHNGIDVEIPIWFMMSKLVWFNF